MIRTIEEINDKIRKGKVVVATAEEVVGLVEDNGVKHAARQVDIVTTGTFGPMCSSGIYFNIKQTTPKIKAGGGRAYLDGVPCYTGWAAADLCLGATAIPDEDPRNAVYPGLFERGGAHVIEDLLRGKKMRLELKAYGTDCYPRKEAVMEVGLEDFTQATMFNPRNCYQLYNVAVNLGKKTIYTYMGVLKANLGNANFSTAGALSPLLNDPRMRTIGIGTRILLGGAPGYVAWNGTQHVGQPTRDARGLPLTPSATLCLMADLKQMDPRYVRGASLVGYGASLALGVGVPIPILTEEVMADCAVTDKDITYPIVDYNENYPLGRSADLGRVSMAELMTGTIEVSGKKVPTGSLTSRSLGREMAGMLKEKITRSEFMITRPVASLPGGELIEY